MKSGPLKFAGHRSWFTNIYANKVFAQGRTQVVAFEGDLVFCQKFWRLSGVKSFEGDLVFCQKFWRWIGVGGFCRWETIGAASSSRSPLAGCRNRSWRMDAPSLSSWSLPLLFIPLVFFLSSFYLFIFYLLYLPDPSRLLFIFLIFLFFIFRIPPSPSSFYLRISGSGDWQWPARRFLCLNLVYNLCPNLLPLFVTDPIYVIWLWLWIRGITPSPLKYLAQKQCFLGENSIFG